MSTQIERYETGPRMSKAVRYGTQIYLCGQTSSGTEAHGIAAQTRVVLERIDALLAAMGSDKSRLLSALIHLQSMDDFAVMNEVWEAWLPQGAAPARTTVQARLAHPALLVEMTAIAAA
jgi:enamine deaminase RidA (YjgF/YER057c/UK114 family)